MKKIGAKILVNAVTMIRVIGTFLLPIISIKFNAKELVTYIIILLVTDMVDGILARRLGVSTLFGSLFDALADKLLGIALLIVIASHYPLMLLPVITEVLITLINTSGGSRGSSIESSKLGKFKTLILGICIVIAFLTIYAKELVVLFDNTTPVGLKIVGILNKMIGNPKIIINDLALVAFGSGMMVAFDYYLRAKREIKNSKNVGMDAKKYKLKKGKDLIYALFDENIYKKTKNEPILARLGYKEE